MPDAKSPENVRIEPTEYEFGSCPIGEESGPAAFTVTNISKAAVQVEIPRLDDPPGSFVIAGGSYDIQHPTTLAPGQSCTIDVNFVPRILGAEGASLEVPTDGLLLVAQLSGEGDRVGGLASASKTSEH